MVVPIDELVQDQVSRTCDRRYGYRRRDPMDTEAKILEEADRLSSKEGVLQTWMELTLLTRERVEKIYDVGYPFLYPLPQGFQENEQQYIDIVRDEGQDKTERDKAVGALNSLGELRDMEIEEKERLLAEYHAAVERGEDPPVIPELEEPREVQDHLEEVARLSGETLDTIQEVYRADIAHMRRMHTLVERMVRIKAQQQE